MKNYTLLKQSALAVVLTGLFFASCKKSGTDVEKEREEQKNEAARKQAILDKISGKTYSLVVIENATTGENLMASAMFPACIADDTFTTSNSISISFDYGTALCVSTARTVKGNYTFKALNTDSIKFSGMDEAPAYSVKGIRKQDTFMVKEFNENAKTMVLSYKLANGQEVIRRYTYQ